MKFFATLFAAGAVATAVKRQSGGIDAITSDIAAIQAATESLTTTISGYSGVSDAPAVLSAVTAVTDAISQGQSDVGATDTLSITDASALVGPVGDLATAVTAAVDATIAQQDAFNTDGLCTEVQNQLSSIQSAATSFSDALVAIVPEALQSTAQGLAQPISDDLQRGVDAFSDCPATSSSSSSEPTSTATSSESSSEATPTSSAGTPPAYGSSSSSSAPSYATPTGYSTPSGSAAPSGSVPPSGYPAPSSTKATPTTTPPATYTGAANAFAPAFGGIVAAGLAVLAL